MREIRRKKMLGKTKKEGNYRKKERKERNVQEDSLTKQKAN